MTSFAPIDEHFRLKPGDWRGIGGSGPAAISDFGAKRPGITSFLESYLSAIRGQPFEHHGKDICDTVSDGGSGSSSIGYHRFLLFPSPARANRSSNGNPSMKDTWF